MAVQLYLAENDGLISEDQSNPLTLSLYSDQNEEKEVRLYAEAQGGPTISNFKIMPGGLTVNKWAFAPDNNGVVGTYEAQGSPLSLGTVEGRVYFWAKVKATNDESTVSDTSVSLYLMGIPSLVMPWWDEGGFSNSLTSITTSWAAVINATSYEVRINGGTPIAVPSGTTYTFNDLEAETQYEVDIRAFDGTVYSAWNSITVQTAAFAPSGDQQAQSQTNEFTTGQ